MSELAVQFRNELNRIEEELMALPPALADVPWRKGGWTRRQILGHLLDSAANNHQRFVRASTEGHYEGPTYDQEPWVAAHGYAEQSWETLLRWWKVSHEILTAVVDRISEERLDARCVIGGDEPVPLRFVATDYLRHQRHHLEQMSKPRLDA